MNDGSILFRRCDATLTLFLEAMQNKDRFFELHGIYSTIGAAPIVFDNLKHSGAAKAREHLRRIVLITGLSKRKSVPEESPDGGG